MTVLELLCAFAGRSGRFRVHWSRGGPGGDGGTSRSIPLCRLAGQKTVSVAQKTAQNGRGFGRRFRPERRNFIGTLKALLAPGLMGPSRSQ